MTSWFEMSTPRDLLSKLRADCSRVQNDPFDSYAAFDFFVTAWHMLDWTYPGRDKKILRDNALQESSLLGICEHVANGAKHLKLGNPNLQSVERTGAQGPFDSTFDQTFDRARLVLHLDGQAKRDFGDTVEVAELAPRIVEWWETKLGTDLTSPK